MFEQRNLRLDLCALFLLALTLFLTVALTSYDPADPVAELARSIEHLYAPDVLVYPMHDKVHNACGRWGALVADVLFQSLGLGAYYLLVSLAVLNALLLQRRAIDSPLVRLVGWLASLAGITTLLAMLLPTFSPGPVIGSGGYLGALLHHWLELHFARLGGCILCVSVILGGLLLSTDYVLVRWTYLATRTTLRLLRLVVPRRALARATDVEADSAPEPESSDAEPGLSVRIGGKTVVRPIDDEELDEDYDDETDDVDEDDEEEVDEWDESGAESVPQAGRAAVAEVAGRSVRTDPQYDADGPRVRKRAAKSELDLVKDSLDQASRGNDAVEYQLPSIDLLIPGEEVCGEAQEKEVRRKAKILERTFADFGYQVKVVEIETGPVIAQYEVQLEAGLRLSKITGLADDLAIALRVPSVRIVAPIPGKNTVGIEVPNSERQVVRLREVLEQSNGKAAKMRIPLFLGKDVSGNPLTVDLSTLPHLLIAGRTGTGKSVCLNAIISSILMTKRPDEVRMLMIDPKMVELSGYGRLPHLMHPVVTDMKKAEAILAWAVDKMEERYALLARAGVRHISSYNQLSEEELMERLRPETDEERANIPLNLPFIVIVADEMADLMMTAGKEVEQHIIRLAQKSRAVGIHLILATQKPTVDVITGLIKSNLPARIAFQVASRTDSRVVLDEMGADKLLGNGDMLFLWPGTSTLLRGQGTYLSDDEIERIVDFVSTGEQDFVHELVNIKVKDAEGANEPGTLRKRDELYEQAVDVVVREGRGSVSLLQRALGIGYGRAARLIDYMQEDGIVGEYAGSHAREVLISISDWERMQSSGGSSGSAPEPPPARPAPPARRSNRILPSRDGWGADTPAPARAPASKRAPVAVIEEPDQEDEYEEDEAYDVEDADDVLEEEYIEDESAEDEDQDYDVDDEAGEDEEDDTEDEQDEQDLFAEGEEDERRAFDDQPDEGLARRRPAARTGRRRRA